MSRFLAFPTATRCTLSLPWLSMAVCPTVPPASAGPASRVHGSLEVMGRSRLTGIKCGCSANELPAMSGTEMSTSCS